MKTFKATFSAIAFIAATSFMGTTAMADGHCNIGCTDGWSDTATFNFSAGGLSVNEGIAQGDATMSASDNAKYVYGGGESRANTRRGGFARAKAYSGSDFETMGSSSALSMGPNNSRAYTSELGRINGGGFSATTMDWSYGPND